MEYEITNRPAFTQLDVALDAEEGIRAEAGSLVSHSRGVAVTADDESRESLSDSLLEEHRPFSTTFTANRPGTVALAPPFPGDVFHFELRDEALYSPSLSFLAVESDVTLDAGMSENQQFLNSAGDFLLELSGSGSSFLSSYGTISVLSLNSDEGYVVDTGHVVAFEESVEFSVRRSGSVKSVTASDARFVCEFEGPGTIWTQSRSPSAFLAWLVRNLPGER